MDSAARCIIEATPLRTRTGRSPPRRRDDGESRIQGIDPQAAGPRAEAPARISLRAGRLAGAAHGDSIIQSASLKIWM
jgi:hypothetical protein